MRKLLLWLGPAACRPPGSYPTEPWISRCKAENAIWRRFTRPQGQYGNPSTEILRKGKGWRWGPSVFQEAGKSNIRLDWPWVFRETRFVLTPWPTISKSEIEAMFLLTYKSASTSEGLEQFKELHRQHKAALVAGRLADARAAMESIFQLSWNLDGRYVREHYPRRPDSDPAMLVDAFSYGALICCYLAGDFRRRSPAYPKDFSRGQNSERL